MPTELQQLVRQCLANDQSAMRELVERFAGQVFGLCYRMLGDRHDAEDVSQESFCRALRSLRNWDSRREFTPWLLAIAGNRCRTWLAARSKRLQPARSLDGLAVWRPLRPELEGLSDELQRALAPMRSDYRRAFLLFHQDELSYQEIAAALDCPLGTVKTWVHRARRELAERLIENGVVEANVLDLR